MPDRGRDVTKGLELSPSLSQSDRSLIRLLQEDGRRSYAQLSRELGVAQKTVRRRVRELQERGIIQITIVADPALMGYGMIALIGIRIDSSHAVSAVAARLAKARGAFYVIIVTGRYNVLVEVSCRDYDDLMDIVENEVAAVPGVAAFEIHPYLRLHYQNPSFEAARVKAIAAGETRQGRFSFDQIDREILARLHDDGRTPYQTIAHDLRVSESQVRQRVSHMIRSGLLHIMALTIPKGLGFETVALIGIRLNLGALAEEVAATLASVPAVIYVAICAGRYDVLAEVVCRDGEDLLRLIDGELRPLKGVASIEPWIYLKLFYRSVRPAEETPIGPVAQSKRSSGDAGRAAGPDVRVGDPKQSKRAGAAARGP